jgi:hypothetical protein
LIKTLLYKHAVLMMKVGRAVRLVKIVGKSVLGDDVVLYDIWGKCSLYEVLRL